MHFFLASGLIWARIYEIDLAITKPCPGNGQLAGYKILPNNAFYHPLSCVVGICRAPCCQA